MNYRKIIGTIFQASSYIEVISAFLSAVLYYLLSYLLSAFHAAFIRSFLINGARIIRQI